ncbi:MAG: substrate-binding domain-containing protein [Hyphomicrobiaceae bacterium]|nr:substrate-binding domain-containing protein [Hyphomicrobiaceae bacterium]
MGFPLQARLEESKVSRTLVAFSAAVAATGAFGFAGAADARDHIKIVGSSTVFPYSQAVAEEFTRKAGNKAPVVESTGTGGGMKIFCQGIGVQHPDIVGASRAMKKSEFADCEKHGVTDVTEVLIGYDGLSIARSRKARPMDLTKPQIYLALAAEVPVGGKLVANPYKKWSEIDKSLPDRPILAYGPPPTSGTRDAFVELAMNEGCEALDFVKAQKQALDKKAYGDLVRNQCSRMRQDGPFIEAGENDNLIVQRLEVDTNAVGIFGYSFLYENEDKLQAVKVGGVEPSFETIASGAYGISRPLFVYVKNAHREVIPGLKELVAEYVSEQAMGKDGYLAARGMVPLPPERLGQMRATALGGKKMAVPTK